MNVPLSRVRWDADAAQRLIAAFPAQPTQLLPALHALQQAFGHIARPAFKQLASHFNLSEADVYGVVTFYHDFRSEPPGQHVLKLCRAEACQAVGGEAIAAKAKDMMGVAFGGTSADGRWTLEPVFCLGLCASGPSALVDGAPVGRLDEKRLGEILAAGRT